jgi:ribonuclease HI
LRSRLLAALASAKDSKLGAATVILGVNNDMRRNWQGGIGSAKYWNIHAAELIAICQADKMAQGEAEHEITEDKLPTRKFTIISDSQSALQALARPSNKPGQAIVRHILERQLQLRLQWIPGHCDNPGNGTADKLAKEAVRAEEDNGFHHMVSALKRTNRDKMLEEWRKEWCSTEKGSICGKSTADCHPSGLSDYMAHCLGIEHIYSHNFELAIPGWQHSQNSTVLSRRTGVYAGQ